jgi:integrase
MVDEIIKDVPVVIEVTPQNLTKMRGKVKSELPAYWDAEFVNERIDAKAPGMHKMLYLWLWMTGTRITECLSVRKRDLDLPRYCATVRWLKNRKYLHRVIALHPKLKAILEPYTAAIGLDDRLFPISRQRAWQIIKKDFEGHPHQFRHSFAVHWLRSGGDVVMLSRALGHSKLEHTMVYLRIVPMDVGKELIKIPF